MPQEGSLRDKAWRGLELFVKAELKVYAEQLGLQCWKTQLRRCMSD